MEKTGWTLPGYDDKGWNGVKETTFPLQKLVATVNEPIKKQENFVPQKIFRTPKGENVIDFGQNLVGWVKIRVTGKAGDKIMISHAEALDKKGNFYTENLRAARAQDTYILKGGSEEVFEPHFTFHGFRYINIEGYPGEIKPDNFTAVALYSDMKPTGIFISSNALINQLQHNIRWGQKGNFLDVPTDCPQRDERLGWTGDAQVFSRTATFNMDVNNFFSKWLNDVAADQMDGAVPFVIPNVLGENATNSTAGPMQPPLFRGICTWRMATKGSWKTVCVMKSMGKYHGGLPENICGTRDFILATGCFIVLKMIMMEDRP